MEVKVVKFGGTSLANAEQIKKVAAIIKSDPSRRYVIPSAPGKRFPGDRKVTDLLYDLYGSVNHPEEFDSIFEVICNRYREIIKDLGLDFSLENDFERIKKHILRGTSKDYCASRGEYLNGKIIAKYLDFPFIDPIDCIFFKENGYYDSDKTNEALKEILKTHEYAVIPGFFGANEGRHIVTFSRGGSDITGSIVARAACATLYENWTDVSGFLICDPRIVPNPKAIDIITYKELRELSYMGASVLHEEAVFPVRYVGIPIQIKNTNAPEDKGTLIVPKADEDIPYHIITGIAGKQGFCSINIEKDLMNSEVGFGKKVLEIIANHGICFEHLPSSIDSMSLVINSHELEPFKKDVIAEIYREVEPDSLMIEEHISLIAIVGRGMVRAKGTAARIFRALANANINIKMIDQGSCEMNIIVGVEDKDFTAAIKAIYSEFII